MNDKIRKIDRGSDGGRCWCFIYYNESSGKDVVVRYNKNTDDSPRYNIDYIDTRDVKDIENLPEAINQAIKEGQSMVAGTPPYDK